MSAIFAHGGPLRGRPNRRERIVPSASPRCAHLRTPDARLRPLEGGQKRGRTALRLRTALGRGWGAVSVQDSSERKSGADFRWGTATQYTQTRIARTA